MATFSFFGNYFPVIPLEEATTVDSLVPEEERDGAGTAGSEYQFGCNADDAVRRTFVLGKFQFRITGSVDYWDAAPPFPPGTPVDSNFPFDITTENDTVAPKNLGDFFLTEGGDPVNWVQAGVSPYLVPEDPVLSPMELIASSETVVGSYDLGAAGTVIVRVFVAITAADATEYFNPDDGKYYRKIEITVMTGNDYVTASIWDSMWGTRAWPGVGDPAPGSDKSINITSPDEPNSFPDLTLQHFPSWIGGSYNFEIPDGQYSDDPSPPGAGYMPHGKINIDSAELTFPDEFHNTTE